MNTWIATATPWLQVHNAAAGMADLVLKSLVILLAAGAVSLGWRRAPASARHLVWFLAMEALVCLPLLSALLPAWHSPLWTVGARTTAENEMTLTLEWVPAAKVPGSMAPAPVTLAKDNSGTLPPTGGQRLETHFRPGWALVALCTWAGGTGVMLFSILVSHCRLGTLRRSARSPMDAEWRALLDRLCAEAGMARRVILLQSEEDVMPVTWGWWRPVILLPMDADDWSPERRRVVLLHELAHVKRRDGLTQLIARVACAIYWFNPLAWLAARQMCRERECACDDLVLNGGCRPSVYAGHLVEIARRFRRVPQAAAIGMARSSQLEGRIAAIVDATRVRRAPRTFLVALGGISVLVFIAIIGGQKAGATGQAAGDKPWYDDRLRAFFVEKAAQAHQLAGTSEVAPQVWPYFDAGVKGDWQTVTNLWTVMRTNRYDGTTNDNHLEKVWNPILETDLAWLQFSGFTEKYALAYGNDIIQSVPAGSIYFGGTDPGRGVITAMSKLHACGNPFYTLTQNQLADGTYLDYLRAMYGADLTMPTVEDFRKAFADYTADAKKRMSENKLKPGESVTTKDGRVQVSGQVAVMEINGLIAKTIFDRNPDHEFYIEESYPLDWTYPYLVPHGLIMKINRDTLETLPAEAVRQDLDYWSHYLTPIIGGWLKDDTSVAEVAAFDDKVYRLHNLDGFTGDPEFVGDIWAQESFSKLRTAIAGIYAWRASHAQTPEEKRAMAKAADLSFRQAFALCPQSPEVINRFVNLLLAEGRKDDALIVAETGSKCDPENRQFKDLVKSLQAMK